MKIDHVEAASPVAQAAEKKNASATARERRVFLRGVDIMQLSENDRRVF